MISLNIFSNNSNNQPPSNTNIEKKANPVAENQKQNEEKVPINFVKRFSISTHLLCIICTDVLDDPKRIDCGHTFCNICITQWLSKSNCCPMCRQKVSKEGMSRDLIALNITNDLEVTCSNNGCPWKNSLLNLKEHLKNCYFDKKKIPTYMKNFVATQSQDQSNQPLDSNDDESNANSNDYLNFNCNIGLKARLYQKNRELMEKVIGQNSLDESNKRDSIMDFLSQN